MAKIFQRVIFCLLILCFFYALEVIGSTYHLFHAGAVDPLANGKQRIVAVIPNTSSVDLEKIRARVSETGEEYGAFVEIYETSTENEQLEVMNIAIDSGVDGILLYPISKTGYDPVLQQCENADIPVVVISQPVDSDRYDTYIGAGAPSERMAVLSCVTATNGTGRVMLLDCMNQDTKTSIEAVVLTPDQENTAPPLGELKTRVANLAENPFEWYQVESVTVLNKERASLKLYFEIYKLLSVQNPDAVFSYDEDITSVVAACLDSSAFLSNIYTVGYGDVHELADQLRDQTLDGVVVQNDAYAASLAVRYLVALRKDSVMPSVVDAGIMLVTPDNLERILLASEK